MTQAGRPDWSAVGTLLDEVKRAWSQVGETQRRLSVVTGTAWSPDRTVKVVVGARGQLVDVEIDPKVFRKPDSKALAAAILAAARLAVEQATGQVRELVEESVPSDLRSAGLMSPDVEAMVYGHDADALRGEGSQ